MKRVVVALSVVLLSAATLCGCGGIDLDREVSSCGLTYNVSSQWVEDDSEEFNSDNYDDRGLTGWVSYTSDEDLTFLVRVEFSNKASDLDETADEAIESYIARYEKNEDGYYEYTDVQCSEVDNVVIDGTKCTVYEYSYTQTDGDSHLDYHNSIAYIMKSNMHYSIDVMDADEIDCVSLAQQILDTVSL